MYYCYRDAAGMFLVEGSCKSAADYIARGVSEDANFYEEYATLEEADWDIGEELDVY